MEYTININKLDLFPALNKIATGECVHEFYFGLDAEQSTCAVSVIIDGGTPIYFGKHLRDDIVGLVTELITLNHTVALSQEACGFGYEFHRDLEEAGAQSIVTAPEALNGKRKTDKADSRKQACDLYSYLKLGNDEALRPIRVPSLKEQQLRALHRERAQTMSARNQLAAQARSLVVSFNILDVPTGWWGPKKWPVWEATLKASGQDWILERITPKVELIRIYDQQIKALDQLTLVEAFERHQDLADTIDPTTEIVQPSPHEFEGDEMVPRPITTPAQYETELLGQIPKGFGVRTILGINAEMCDWSRFNNRKQVGSYIGACPSEYSSGSNQRLGSIDRQGNGAVRTMLVEAAWRMVRFQPGWRGFKKFGVVLFKGSKASKTARRKAIIAVARLLAIDIWRLQTGRCSLEELGFTPGLKSETA